ncbi:MULTISPECIES: hypothetical protein [unclassified Acinetobacter]|nr:MULTISPECIES: hypothetical protein [unclassified Acinetobacter]
MQKVEKFVYEINVQQVLASLKFENDHLQELFGKNSEFAKIDSISSLEG